MVSNVKVHDCDAIKIHLLKRLCGGAEESCAKPSSVRRNLFGMCHKKVVSHGAYTYSRSLEKEFRDQAKRASREWNFDFVNEVPLTGKYHWQRVRSCEVPSWYAAIDRPTFKDLLSTKECPDKSAIGLSKSEIEIRLDGLKNQISDKKREQPSTHSKKPRLVQTSMKDFTRVQKRRSSRRLQLKQLQLYSSKSRLLRNHVQPHHLPLHPRSIATLC